MSGKNPANAGRRIIQAAQNIPNYTIDVTGPQERYVADGTFTTVPAVTELFDPTAPKSIKDLPLDQFKPTPGEGTFEFWSRLIKRFALWTWCSGDGSTLIVDAPDFEQAPSYSIVRRLDGFGNNVEDGEDDIDGSEQPSVIIATGYGGGGFRDRATLKVAMVNELIGCDSSGGILPVVQQTIDRFPGIHVLPIRRRLIDLGLPSRFNHSRSRPRYLHDDESRNQGQL
jgi:hypothetical protein